MYSFVGEGEGRIKCTREGEGGGGGGGGEERFFKGGGGGGGGGGWGGGISRFLKMGEGVFRSLLQLLNELEGFSP